MEQDFAFAIGGAELAFNMPKIAMEKYQDMDEAALKKACMPDELGAIECSLLKIFLTQIKTEKRNMILKNLEQAALQSNDPTYIKKVLKEFFQKEGTDMFSTTRLSLIQHALKIIGDNSEEVTNLLLVAYYKNEKRIIIDRLKVMADKSTDIGELIYIIRALEDGISSEDQEYQEELINRTRELIYKNKASTRIMPIFKLSSDSDKEKMVDRALSEAGDNLDKVHKVSNQLHPWLIFERNRQKIIPRALEIAGNDPKKIIKISHWDLHKNEARRVVEHLTETLGQTQLEDEYIEQLGRDCRLFLEKQQIAKEIMELLDTPVKAS